MHTGPWLHVGLFFIGCYLGDKYPKAERQLVDEINRVRKANGLAPLAGTNYWIKYYVPDEEMMQPLPRYRPP
jgi:hypothetical protein